MIITDKYKHGIHFYNVWFADEPIGRKGIIQYHEASFCGGGFTPFDTLISDLTDTEEDIKSSFSKNCKYEVNRGIREEIEVYCYSSGDISNELIEEFVLFYNDFWRSKGVAYSDSDWLSDNLKRYRDAGSLSITIASKDAKRIIYHTHVHDSETVRLFHSASLYRLDEDDRNRQYILGIANRYLHYREMCYFKNQGLKTYDWGGAGQDEEVKNITKFKASFGGKPKTNYDGETAVGIKAKAFKLIAKLVR